MEPRDRETELLRSVCRSIDPKASPRTEGERRELICRAFEAAYGLPLEGVVTLLCGVHGHAAVKRALKRHRGPSASPADNARIWAYVEVIKRCTSATTRSACQWLAKVGIPIEKDAVRGSVTFVLQNAETIRQRCMRTASAPPFSAVALAGVLIQEWHASGKPFNGWFRLKLKELHEKPLRMTPNLTFSRDLAQWMLDHGPGAETVPAR
jgi:hypothetical protein